MIRKSMPSGFDPTGGSRFSERDMCQHINWHLRKFVRETSGVAGVEFALLSLVFFTAFIGVTEVARYVADQQDLMHAVHTTGRYAIVHGANSSSPATTAALQTMVGSNLVLLSSSAVTTTVSFSPNNSPGGTVTITASYTWAPIVPITGLPKTTITATSAATILN
jgi:Flp pilus assembly protein TadG